MAPVDAGPEKEGVLILQTSGSQVIFPAVRASFEVSAETFRQVCVQLEKQFDQTVVGVVAARPAKARRDAGAGGELYEVGTYCRLVSHSTVDRSDGSADESRVRLVVMGQSRMRVLAYAQTAPLRIAAVRLLEEAADAETDVTLRALVSSVQEKMTAFMHSGQEGNGNARRIRWPESPSQLASVVGGALPQLSVEERQQILETDDLRERLETVLDLLQREAEAKRVSGEINSSLHRSRELELRRVVLQRQIQEVQKDLRRVQSKKGKDSEEGEEDGWHAARGDDSDEEADEAKRLGEKLAQSGLPEEAQKIAKRELKRLKSIKPQNAEYTNVHTYLEVLASLPWSERTQDRFSLAQARAMMDEDHCGLESVKKRMLEFLAVQKMRGDMKGPILCLHGPPGIGKTSLGRSVARALGRKFHRVALGGVRDEAEIRGHRRTYIGSIPGVIIQAIQTCGVNNPVILLDEVDKMAQNSQFNPQATLLEVLDPEQNDSFKDHYLNTPFDLSKVLFICTANDTSLIDRPLLDRMEVVELSGYTAEEKVSIASTHLIPKQRRLHALEPEAPRLDEASESAPSQGSREEPRLVLPPEAVSALVQKWTSESGVRDLERRVAQVCRWAALRLQGIGVMNDQEKEAALASCGPDAQGHITVGAEHLPYIVGAAMSDPDIAERLTVGVAMGLSVSSVGGNLLFIEAARTRGSGRLTVTGRLGDVMSESVNTALSLLRSRFVLAGVGARAAAPAFNSEVLTTLQSSGVPAESRGTDAAPVSRDPFRGEDVHVHFPAGGIPKDGPSAGVAVLLAVASLLMGRPMRSDTAVTGEVTLRGHVLPVGGIRDKVLAAHRAGIKHVLLPLANKRNVLEDIPSETLRKIEVHYIKHTDEALDWAFGRHVNEADVAALAAPDLPPGVPATAAAALSRPAGSYVGPPPSRL